MHGTYLRLDIAVCDNWRAVVRAASRKLKPKARRDPALRSQRKQLSRQMLDAHRNAQGMVGYWRL